MADPEEASPSLLGGRYALEEPIGYGGMSTVYRARDEALGRAVAVKLYHPAASDVPRQESELAVLASLDHHSLVHLFDAGADTDRRGRQSRYLVMALVHGPTLQQRVAQGRMGARHIGEIGYDMAEALDYIHAHGVVHRDIKPSNILLVDYGNEAQRARAKLTDFGVALTGDIERMTAQGLTTGTAAYLSPEQASGAEVGPASDVYALGLVLLECFTRALEFPGGVVESALARLSRDPVIPDWLPEHWQRLLLAMTARDPAARPVRSELVGALRQVVITDSARHKEPTEPLFLPLGPIEERPKPDSLEAIPDQALQRATALAARLFSAPIAVVSVVDQDRLWLKSYYGAEVEEIARHADVSSSIVPLDEPIVIEDGRTDPRAMDSALVTGPLGIRFYVGVPLRSSSDGRTIGTLSVLGIVPGTASEVDIANLEDVAALVVAQLELRQEGIRKTAG